MLRFLHLACLILSFGFLVAGFAVGESDTSTTFHSLAFSFALGACAFMGLGYYFKLEDRLKKLEENKGVQK